MSRVIHSENVEKLVSRQGRLWDLRREMEKQLLRSGRGKVGELSFGPYLLISRELGAGAIKVGALVGQRLHWPVFDRRIVDEIARTAHVREQLVETVDEHARNVFEDIVREVLMPRGIGTDSYLYNLRRVVLTLGHQGDVIIIGRCADQILPPEFGLRVRLVAPLEERVRRVQEREELTYGAAREMIHSADREREEFVRRYFSRDSTDPHNYDLVINTGGKKLETVAEIVMGALQWKLGVASPAK